MRIIKFILLVILFVPCLAFGQYKSRLGSQQWVDSVFNSLTPEQRIAQLMVIRAHSNLGPDHIAKVVSDIQQYNVGALCFFPGRSRAAGKPYQLLSKHCKNTFNGDYIQ